MHTETIKQTKENKFKIPDKFVYEILDGIPIYYKNYEEVLNNNKKFQEIMGSSILQSLLIDSIIMFLHENLDRKLFKIASNELGLHISSKNNLAADIAIYEKTMLKNYDINNKYAEIPPKIIIEVDTKADLSNFDETMDYIDEKTKKLLDFGTEQIIWILTKSKKIILSTEKTNWTIADWSLNIEIIANIYFNLEKIIKEEDLIKI